MALRSIDMVYCPKCGGDKIVKNGFVKGKQRLRCKPCKFNYTKYHTSYIDNLVKIMNLKRIALHMRIEGLSLSYIARTLNSNKPTVKRWIDSGINEIRKSKINNRLGADYLSNEDIIERINKNPDTSYYIVEFPSNNWKRGNIISFLYF